MPNLTDILSNSNSRIGALENDDLDEASSIARITKIYGNVKVTVTVVASIHQYPICNTTTICNTTLII